MLKLRFACSLFKFSRKFKIFSMLQKIFRFFPLIPSRLLFPFFFFFFSHEILRRDSDFKGYPQGFESETLRELKYMTLVELCVSSFFSPLRTLYPKKEEEEEKEAYISGPHIRTTTKWYFYRVCRLRACLHVFALTRLQAFTYI